MSRRDFTNLLRGATVYHPLAASLCGLLIASVPMCRDGRAAETFPPGLYELTTEIGMPHLEENLRYAITRENHCLRDQKLASAFPILNNPALKECRLDRESRHGDAVSYLLICEGGHGTTGTGQWHLGTDLIRGVLEVRMGGKNMTFYQRIKAKPLGECGVEAK